MGRFFASSNLSDETVNRAREASQTKLVQHRGGLPLHLTFEYLQTHMGVQDNQVLCTNDGHTMFFGRQRAPEWIEHRKLAVWTASRPSGGFFPRSKHWQTYARIHHAFPEKERKFKNLFRDAFGSGNPVELQDNSVLTGAYAVFRVQEESDSYARQQNMAHGTKTEDVALRQFVQTYFPHDGVVVEEFLHTAPYHPQRAGDLRTQGCSPDGLLLVRQPDGGFELAALEIKCAAGCQDKDCKSRRTKLAKQLRKDSGGLHAKYCQLHQRSVDAPLEAMRAKLHAYVERNVSADVKFEPTDNVTTMRSDLQTAKDLDLVYCTNPRHKPAHKCVKTYYVPQMMLEMFHTGTCSVVYVAHGTEIPGGVVNAFKMQFDPKVLAATALFMETQRQFAAFCRTMFVPKPKEEGAQENALWNYATGTWCAREQMEEHEDPSVFDESKTLRKLYRTTNYYTLYARLHQCQAFLSRLCERASLGGSLYPLDDSNFWHTKDACGVFWREWTTSLDETSRNILAGAHPLPAARCSTPVPRELTTAEAAAGMNPHDPPPFMSRLPSPSPMDHNAVRERVRQAWQNSQRDAFYAKYPQLRDFSFERPSPQLYAPLSLDQLRTKYEAYAEEYRRTASGEPAPLSVVAPMLAPQGFVTEIMTLKDSVPRFHVPNDKKGSPNAWKSRFQFVGEPFAQAPCLKMHDLFPTKQTLSRRQYWCNAFNGYKQAPPLRIGMYDPDDAMRVWHNLDGSCDATLQEEHGARSVETIPQDTPCRFIVNSVSDMYKPIAYVSAILLPKQNINS